MQFRNIIAVLFFFLANICLASAQGDDEVVFVTMTTEVEVTSTVYLDTITMTGSPTTTEEPDYVPLTTMYNGTWVPEPTGTGTNTTAPTPSTPAKDDTNGAASFSGSIRVAVAAGALAAVMGML